MSASTIVTANIVSPIASLRAAAVEAEVSSYGARRAYAAGINDLAAGTAAPWFEDGAELPKAVKAEKDEYYKALKAINYSNPSNAWKMVKVYAREDAIARGLWGMVPPEETGEGEGEGEGTARHVRDLTTRIIDDLVGLYKCGKRAESLSTKEQNAMTFIVSGLSAMGVDVSMIDTK